MKQIADNQQNVANKIFLFSSVLTILHSNIVSQLENGEAPTKLIGTYKQPSSKRQLATRKED